MMENPTWDDIDNGCQKIILELRRLPSRYFDAVIGILRGGIVPAVILSHKLRIPYVYGLGLRYYDEKKPGENVRVYQGLPSLRNSFVFLVDDVCDSGRTMKFAAEFVEKTTGIAPVTASLHLKPSSIFNPTFHVWETSGWITYPWEVDGLRIQE